MAKEPKISFQDLEAAKLEALLLKIQPLLEPADFHLLEQVVSTSLLVLDAVRPVAPDSGKVHWHFNRR